MTFALLNLALCSLGYTIAYLENRFTHGQLGPQSIPYLWHGGVWADWIIITAIASIASPYARGWSEQSIVICLAISGLISIVAHIVWANLQTIPGHIIEPSGSGLAKLPVGGWYHLLYMTLMLTLVLLFYLYSPSAPRLGVSILLTIFIVPAIIQPGWYVAKIVDGVGRIDAAGWIVSISAWILIWVVGYTRP